ncbi:MAG: Biopolymer transport protein ExbD [Verrucomicrobiota bacterium]|jgi:biopolymer transport protein ExbD
MKRISNQRQLRLISEINITPMLDLVLVLMFVFLLAAPLMKRDKALSPAPQASQFGEDTPNSSVRLLMHKDQSVTLDGAILARADLPSALKQLVAQRPGTGVEVRMHHELNVQQLVKVMGMLEDAGIRKTAVTTHTDEP